MSPLAFTWRGRWTRVKSWTCDSRCGSTRASSSDWHRLERLRQRVNMPEAGLRTPALLPASERPLPPCAGSGHMRARTIVRDVGRRLALQFNLVRHETSLGALNKSATTMAATMMVFGGVAAVYAAVEAGMEAFRGQADWKNGAVGGLAAGACRRLGTATITSRSLDCSGATNPAPARAPPRPVPH